MVSAIPFFIHKRRINILKEYLKAQNKTNETILRNTYSLDELGRFSKSDYRWADNRIKSFQHRMHYLHKVFSLLHLFKKGNVGFVQIFFVHKFTVLGFINQNMKQTDNSISKNVIKDTLFSLSDSEILECNNFLLNISNHEFDMMKEIIDEFIWGLEQTDIPTGFVQYTTALEMTLLEKGERGKKEALSKRVSVLLESDTEKMLELYNKMKNFYRYRSESLHEGNGQNITIYELKNMEEIVRHVLVKYLEFCKIAISLDSTTTWDTIKKDKISDLKSAVVTAISSNVLPM